MLSRSAARGITLIEVMVTVSVLVLITLASMPSFTTWNANSRVRAAAEGLQNGLRLAQAEGVRANANITLRLTTPNSSAASPTGINWSVLDAAGTTLQRKATEGASGVTMAAKDASGATPAGFAGEIVFNGLGQSSLASTVRFDFSASGADRNLTVLLSPGGRVRMCDPQRPSGDPQYCDLPAT